MKTFGKVIRFVFSVIGGAILITQVYAAISLKREYPKFIKGAFSYGYHYGE